MTVLCDTSTVQVGEGPELWADPTSRLFVPLECEPRGPGFQGRLRAGTVGSLALCHLQASPHRVRRTRRLAAGTDGDSYKLSLLLDGRALVEQDGREVVLRPGDFAIYDCSRPYTVAARESLGMLVCLLPHTEVKGVWVATS